jgi:hypothetical protein
MIDPIMPYTNVDIFREREYNFFKKSLEPLKFMKIMAQ